MSDKRKMDKDANTKQVFKYRLMWGGFLAVFAVVGSMFLRTGASGTFRAVHTVLSGNVSLVQFSQTFSKTHISTKDVNVNATTTKPSASNTRLSRDSNEAYTSTSRDSSELLKQTTSKRKDVTIIQNMKNTTDINTIDPPGTSNTVNDPDEVGRGIQDSMPQHKTYTDLGHPTNLDPTLIPSTAFYVWCGTKVFEFPHYLSILSVVKYLQADNIIFYYQKYPHVDPRGYNSWFRELRDYLPFLTVLQLEEEHNGCQGTLPSLEFVAKLLREHGGVYVGPKTLLNRTPNRNSPNPGGINIDTMEGVIFHSGKDNGTNMSKKREFCQSINVNTTQLPDDVPCAILQSDIYPKDIWQKSDDAVGRMLSTIFYGRAAIPKVVPSSDSLVPNIAHMVWIGGGAMNFLFYMGVLSLVYVAEVEKVYIHGDQPPAGQYWDKVKNIRQVVFRYRNVLEWNVYGQKIIQVNHMSDVMRADILYKYGGFYVDTDVIFVRPLEVGIRQYDAVASYSVASRSPFPDSIATGVLLGKPGAIFWRLFQRSMREFNTHNRIYSPLLVPYKIQEKYPWTLRIDQRIVTTCIRKQCCAMWIPNYLDIEPEERIRRIRNETFALHFLAGKRYTPAVFKNETLMMTSQNTSAYLEIGRFILSKAGLYPSKAIV